LEKEIRGGIKATPSHVPTDGDLFVIGVGVAEPRHRPAEVSGGSIGATHKIKTGAGAAWLSLRRNRLAAFEPAEKEIPKTRSS